MLHRDEEAEALWHEVYPMLKESADEVPHTDRARPYAVRLSMVYALADRSATISRQHLEAALAVWAFCRQSARVLFAGAGELPQAEAEPVWLKLLGLIQARPGIARSELLRGCRSADAGQLDEVLAWLARNGIAFSNTQKPEGGGRPAECWWPVPGLAAGMGFSVDTPPLLLPAPAADRQEGNNSQAGSMEAGEAGKERQEGNNLLPAVGGEFIPSFPVPPGEMQAAGQAEAAGRAEAEEGGVIQSASADEAAAREKKIAELEDEFLEGLDK